MYVAQDIQKRMKLNSGGNLWELTQSKNVLLVFLRHFGCVFCKEAMKDLAAIKQDIRDKGVELTFVHLSLIHISEPTRPY